MSTEPIKLKAVAYCRVSPKEALRAELSKSLEVQATKVRMQCSMCDYDLAEQDIFTDDQYSGSSLDRPGLQKMLQRLCVVDPDDAYVASWRTREKGAAVRRNSVRKKSNHQAVVVHHLDRLTRSPADLDQLIREFQRRGIRLIAIGEGLDTSTAVGRLTMGILMQVAQWQRECTAERTAECMIQAQINGISVGGKPPYGWSRTKHGRLVLNEDEQRTLNLITSMADQGRTVGYITRNLNKLEIRTRAGREWYRTNVTSIIQRYRDGRNPIDNPLQMRKDAPKE